MEKPRFAFCASTGRTATMFVATTLDKLPGVVGLHEGHTPGDPPIPRLPLINLHNRRAWHDTAEARRTVAEKRDSNILEAAAGNANLLVDVAFYNSPLMDELALRHPESALLVIFRRCEGFVRSATIVSGEDRQPAGWPDRSKSMTDRERFISLGRLKPQSGSDDATLWPQWSAIQRNIWLWHTVNSHLHEFSESHANCHTLYFEDLVESPEIFWSGLLRGLNILAENSVSQCVTRSADRINRRPSYQVGPANTWDVGERALYAQLAVPLEKKLYD